MNRDELASELRKLCVAHQGGLGPVFTGKRCDQCDSKMSKIMKLVDAYAASLPVPPLMGKHEAGALLGVSSTRVGHFANEGRIPVVQKLGMGSVFLASDIREFAAKSRPTGHPPKKAKEQE